MTDVEPGRKKSLFDKMYSYLSQSTITSQAAFLCSWKYRSFRLVFPPPLHGRWLWPTFPAWTWHKAEGPCARSYKRLEQNWAMSGLSRNSQEIVVLQAQKGMDWGQRISESISRSLEMKKNALFHKDLRRAKRYLSVVSLSRAYRQPLGPPLMRVANRRWEQTRQECGGEEQSMSSVRHFPPASIWFACPPLISVQTYL